MRVCPTCGVIAPIEGSPSGATGRCGACGVVVSQLSTTGSKAAALVPVEVESTVDAMWVRVECSYDCPGCGQPSPIDHLQGWHGEGGERVECARCGQIRAFDARSWETTVRHAHDVADLGRPVHAETTLGRYNPHGSVGVRGPFASGTQAAPGEGPTAKVVVSRVRAAPGHPPCPSCHAPLVALEAGGGHLTVRCPRCGESAMYATRPGLYAPLRAVLAEEHRVDRPAAKMDAALWGAPVTLRCPQCSSALVPTAGTAWATCGHCRTVARLPDQARRRALQETWPRPWWMLFAERSPTRDALEGIAASIDAHSRADAPWRAALRGRALGRGLSWLLFGVLVLAGGAVGTALTWKGTPDDPVAWAMAAGLGALLPMVGLVFAIVGIRTLARFRGLAESGEVTAIDVQSAVGRTVRFVSLADPATGARPGGCFENAEASARRCWLAALGKGGLVHLIEPVQWFALPMKPGV